MSRIAPVLKEAIARRNVTQKDVARALDIDPSNVSKWVTGKADPDPDRWADLEAFLQLEPNTLAYAAGHLAQTDAPAAPIGPLFVKAAKDLAELDPADRDAILHMIDTLLRK